MQVLNDPSPWFHGLNGSLTIVDLMARQTIPPKPSALLWWTLEQGVSLLTAGGPSGAGKTTLANAALSFLPDDARVYVMSGAEDPLAMPEADAPSFLLITELSAHGRPTYVSGPAARRAFATVQAGWRMVATLHADSVDEAVGALFGEVGLAADDVTAPAVVAIMRVMNMPPGWRVPRGESGLERRVVEIGLLVPTPHGVQILDLSAWSQQAGQLMDAVPAAGIAGLASWTGVPPKAIEAAVADRAAVLSGLLGGGRHSQEDVVAAVRRYREQGGR